MSEPISSHHQTVFERLQARRRELEAQLGRIRSDRRRERGPLSADSEDRAAELENDEVLDALDDTDRRELRDIETALDRFDSGAFGLCDECGSVIDPDRLEALPWSRYCIGCARAKEEDGGGAPA